MHAGKTGYLYILDRTNGKPLIGIEERPVPQQSRLKTARSQPYPIGDAFVPLCPEQLLEGFEKGCLFSAFWDKPILIAPGSAGGKSWAPISASPKNKLRLRSGQHHAHRVYRKRAAGRHEERSRKRRRFTGFYRPKGLSGRGRSPRWIRRPTRSSGKSGQRTRWEAAADSLSTAGGLLFHGESDSNT